MIYYFSSRSAAPSTIDNLNSSVFTVTPDAKREGGAAEETRTPEKKKTKKKIEQGKQKNFSISNFVFIAACDVVVFLRFVVFFTFFALIYYYYLSRSHSLSFSAVWNVCRTWPRTTLRPPALIFP